MQTEDSGISYWSHVSDVASLEAYRRSEANSLISAETVAENASLIDFRAFALEYPKILFPLVYRLRPEFQELFIEYYLLGKSQSFIASVHGRIQKFIWQNLRIIEQAIGSLIVLGPNPSASVLQPILENAGLANTEYGSLAALIESYAGSLSYKKVAQDVKAPIPAIRKIFRPAINQLLASKNIKEIAVGAYLRSLTHEVSLTGKGLCKRSIARIRKMHVVHFDAPALDNSAFLHFGPDSLKDTPWCMFEISSEHRMSQVYPNLRAHGQKIFAKKSGEIFAPIDDEGELRYGYIFARCSAISLLRSFNRIRGVSEIAATYEDDGSFKEPITIPNADVQKMISAQPIPDPIEVNVGDFVQVLTGLAAHYCGTITQKSDSGFTVRVNIDFPTGRRFVVRADITSVKLLPPSAPELRTFWGIKTVEASDLPKF